MGDFLIVYKSWLDDIEFTDDIILYIEDDIEEELFEDYIKERLEQELECEVDEIIDIISLVDKNVNVEEIEDKFYEETN